DAVLGLRPPSECGDLDAVRLSYRSFDDPAISEAVEAIRRELDRAEAHKLAGRYKEARALADGLAERAQATAFDPLIAELGALRGDLARLSDDEAAPQLLHGALEAAIRADHPRLAATASISLAAYLTMHDRRDEAARWLDLADAWLGERGDLSTRLSALLWRARVLRHFDRQAEADALLARGLELAEPLGRWSAPRLELLLERAQLSVDTLDLAKIQANGGEALALLDEIYGPGHPESADALSALGIAALNRDRMDEAEAFTRRALEIRRQSFGDHNQLVAQSLVNLASIHQDRGDHAETLRLLDEARAIVVETLGADHSLIAKIENNRGSALKQLGRHEESLRALERAIEIRRERPEGGLYAPLLNLAMSEYELGNKLTCDGDKAGARRRYDDGVAHAREAVADVLALRGPDHPHVGIVFTSLGLTLSAVGDHEGALEAFRRALALVERTLGEGSSEAVFPNLGIGRALVELGRPDEALVHLERARAIGIFSGQKSLPHEIDYERARALWATGERAEAIELARSAAAFFSEAECSDAREWLAAHDPERRR
ncbi:MAG: tetratricopeptide repeat protein, partial [Myxococcales bacterium]|nr:tetratricopeptide repeat protein [Myxococcales bacterium]